MWAYFDPMEKNSNGQLFSLYEPRPWKIEYSTWNPSQNMEVVLSKRLDDRSYHRDHEKRY